MLDISHTILIPLLQVCIALGLINVWLFRFKKATIYRGGHAQNMKEEFKTYGLPSWSMYVIGFLKLTIAFILLITLLLPNLMFPVGMIALLVLTILMIGAMLMHIKVHDPLIKIVPALGMFALSVTEILLLNIR